MNEIDILDKNYTEWKTILPCDNIQNPFTHKLFHKDQFDIDLQIKNSPTRNATFLAGILVLENNRTFGRTPNKKKLYYSCIPNQKQLPIFLIPYEIQLGFQKNIQNKFVLFRFDHWLESDKHPYGLLVETIGNVHHLPHYYEYQLYAKNIHPSSFITKYNRKIKDILKQKSLQQNIQEILENPIEYGEITREQEQEQEPRIFTIDPNGCVDRDDALSIQKTENPHIFRVQVYIVNLWVWIKIFDLWELFNNINISTIYLPDFNRNMLPTELSEKICSLNSNSNDNGHFTFVIEFEIDILKKTIIPIYILKQKYIRIHQNFDYESKNLLKYPSYILLLRITREIHPEIKDSHELVAYWMMQMNIYVAKEMHLKKTGIFRITKSFSPSSENICEKPKEISSFLHIWEHAISGEYIEYNDTFDDKDYYHHVILDKYMHFTSPIRRIVDLYNQLLWIDLFINIKNFLPISIQKINEDTKKIKKIQTTCELLHKLSENTITDGFVIQIINEKKTLIYLPIYKCILSCKYNNNIELYNYVKCKIFIFEREYDYKKKIQLSIL